MRTKTILLSASIISLLLWFGMRPPNAAAVPVSVFIRPAVQTSESTAAAPLLSDLSSSWSPSGDGVGWLDRFWIFDRHQPTSSNDTIITVVRLLLLIF